MMEATIAQEVCIHRWKIDAPAGPTSLGICQSCGQWRSFNNSLGFEYEYGGQSIYAAARRLTLGEPIVKVNTGYEWS